MYYHERLERVYKTPFNLRWAGTEQRVRGIRKRRLASPVTPAKRTGSSDNARRERRPLLTRTEWGSTTLVSKNSLFLSLTHVLTAHNSCPQTPLFKKSICPPTLAILQHRSSKTRLPNSTVRQHNPQEDAPRLPDDQLHLDATGDNDDLPRVSRHRYLTTYLVDRSLQTWYDVGLEAMPNFPQHRSHTHITRYRWLPGTQMGASTSP